MVMPAAHRGGGRLPRAAGFSSDCIFRGLWRGSGRFLDLGKPGRPLWLVARRHQSSVGNWPNGWSTPPAPRRSATYGFAELVERTMFRAAALSSDHYGQYYRGYVPKLIANANRYRHYPRCPL